MMGGRTTMDSSCIFCEIVVGERAAKIIYEDKYTLAFLAKSNDVFGHTLVIPKEHALDIFDCSQFLLEQTIKTCQHVSNYYVEKCGFSGINLLNANGIDAEQSVPHLHFHIIPRRDSDTFTTWPVFSEHKHSLEEVYQRLNMVGELSNDFN